MKLYSFLILLITISIINCQDKVIPSIDNNYSTYVSYNDYINKRTIAYKEKSVVNGSSNVLLNEFTAGYSISIDNSNHRAIFTLPNNTHYKFPLDLNTAFMKPAYQIISDFSNDLEFTKLNDTIIDRGYLCQHYVAPLKDGQFKFEPVKSFNVKDVNISNVQSLFKDFNVGNVIIQDSNFTCSYNNETNLTTCQVIYISTQVPDSSDSSSSSNSNGSSSSTDTNGSSTESNGSSTETNASSTDTNASSTESNASSTDTNGSSSSSAGSNSSSAGSNSSSAGSNASSTESNGSSSTESNESSSTESNGSSSSTESNASSAGSNGSSTESNGSSTETNGSSSTETNGPSSTESNGSSTDLEPELIKHIKLRSTLEDTPTPTTTSITFSGILNDLTIQSFGIVSNIQHETTFISYKASGNLDVYFYNNNIPVRIVNQGTYTLGKESIEININIGYIDWVSSTLISDISSVFNNYDQYETFSMTGDSNFFKKGDNTTPAKQPLKINPETFSTVFEYVLNNNFTSSLKWSHSNSLDTLDIDSKDGAETLININRISGSSSSGSSSSISSSSISSSSSNNDNINTIQQNKFNLICNTESKSISNFIEQELIDLLSSTSNIEFILSETIIQKRSVDVNTWTATTKDGTIITVYTYVQGWMFPFRNYSSLYSDNYSVPLAIQVESGSINKYFDLFEYNTEIIQDQMVNKDSCYPVQNEYSTFVTVNDIKSGSTLQYKESFADGSTYTKGKVYNSQVEMVLLNNGSVIQCYEKVCTLFDKVSSSIDYDSTISTQFGLNSGPMSYQGESNNIITWSRKDSSNDLEYSYNFIKNQDGTIIPNNVLIKSSSTGQLQKSIKLYLYSSSSLDLNLSANKVAINDSTLYKLNTFKDYNQAIIDTSRSPSISTNFSAFIQIVNTYSNGTSDILYVNWQHTKDRLADRYVYLGNGSTLNLCYTDASTLLANVSRDDGKYSGPFEKNSYIPEFIQESSITKVLYDVLYLRNFSISSSYGNQDNVPTVQLNNVYNTSIQMYPPNWNYSVDKQNTNITLSISTNKSNGDVVTWNIFKFDTIVDEITYAQCKRLDSSPHKINISGAGIGVVIAILLIIIGGAIGTAFYMYKKSKKIPTPPHILLEDKDLISQQEQNRMYEN